MPIIITLSLYNSNPFLKNIKVYLSGFFLILGLLGNYIWGAPNNERSLRGKSFASICPKTWGCTSNPSPPRFKDSETQKYSDREEIGS